MKKVMLCLMLVIGLSAFGKEKYRIVIRTFDGVSYYYPMAYRRDGKLLKEWVTLTDAMYFSRDQAMDVINRAKEDEKNYKASKKIQIVYVK